MILFRIFMQTRKTEYPFNPIQMSFKKTLNYRALWFISHNSISKNPLPFKIYSIMIRDNDTLKRDQNADFLICDITGHF